jgi:uncharacterized SAM-binding protein YcdF (DUF218 family)
VITDELRGWARKLWDYHHMLQQPVLSDCIFGLGSYDLRVAERGAELYLQGWAPLLIFSGGLGKQTKYMWQQSEAELFADIAVKRGVPEKDILVENKSTNTGENVRFTRALLADKGIDPQRFILVQKPYMERRSYATFMKQWPGKQAVVTSPQISFDDYPTKAVPLPNVIASMVGDLQRIKEYPALGFQIEQPIPDDVWEAYENLVAAGFTKDEIKS